MNRVAPSRRGYARAFFLVTFALLIFSTAVAWADELMVLHPRLRSSGGATLRDASVMTFDTENPGAGPAETFIPLATPMGLAADSDGQPYLGEVSLDPLRVELLGFPAGEVPRSYDAIVDSSILGFINFIGVDTAIRGDSLYFLHGKEFDANLVPIRPTRLLRLGLETGSTELLWETFDDLSGLAVDDSGRVYVGVLRYDPYTVEVMQVAPDGSRRSLGRVFDSSAGFTAGRAFELTARGSSLYFIHPVVFTASGAVASPESIRRLDIGSGGPPVQLVSTDSTFQGIAVDHGGKVFYGSATYEPFRLELRSWTADGGEESHGTIIDSAGSFFDQVKTHMVVRPLPLPGTCRPDPETLCFQDGRFEVSGSWETPDGASGSMRAADVGRKDSAALYFFTPQNLEILVKLLDACELGNYWLFYSATTNVGFELRVRDTVTGAERTYSNPVGMTAEPRLDTGAFTCDP